jgi:hypothetical protein
MEDNKKVINLELEKDYEFNLSGGNLVSLIKAIDRVPYEIASVIHQSLTRVTFGGQSNVQIEFAKNYKVTFKGFEYIEVDKAIKKIDYKDAVPLLDALNHQLVQITTVVNESDANKDQPEHPFTNSAKENNLPG